MNLNSRIPIVDRLEKESKRMDQELKKLVESFIVPNLIGPDRTKFVHLNMREWIKDVEQYKEEVAINIIDNKVKALGS